MENIDFNSVTDNDIYELFKVKGNEHIALNDSYLELFELLGKDATLKIFKYFRSDKIDCPMRLYCLEFVADLAEPISDRRERAKIARAAGYSSKAIESMISKRRRNSNDK